MSRLLPIVIGLAVVVYALVDCVQSPAARIRTMPKPAWLAVIVLVPLLGALGWFVVGRPRVGPAGVTATPPRPLAPDDDPDFMRRLGNLDEEYERLLRQQEREGRGREHDAPAPGEDASGASPDAPRPEPPGADGRPDPEQGPRPDDGKGPAPT